MALLANDWLPAILSSIAYIAALTFFFLPTFLQKSKELSCKYVIRPALGLTLSKSAGQHD